MEFLQQWVGLLVALITVIGGTVTVILSIKNYKRKVEREKIQDEQTLFDKLSAHFDAVFEANRDKAKAEKKLEVLSQQRLCEQQCGRTVALERRMAKREKFDEVLAEGIDVALESLERISKGQETNGTIKPARDKLSNFYRKEAVH